MNAIEIRLVSADGLLSASFSPPEFKNQFRTDWNQIQVLSVPLKSISATVETQPDVKVRNYKKMPDQIKHRRYFNYDGLECWASIRIVTFEEVI